MNAQSSKTPRRCTLVWSLGIAVSLFPGEYGLAYAQRIDGTVRDREGGAPVVAARVVLLADSLDAPVASAVSGDKGKFRLSAERPGRYRLRAESFGYATAVSDTFTLEPLEELQVDLWLSPEPIGLPAVEVRSRRRPLMGNVGLQTFVERRDRGLGGRFVTREDIEAAAASTLADALRAVPGVEVVKHPGRMGWYLIRMNRVSPSLRSLNDPCFRGAPGGRAACLKSQSDPERAAQDLVTGGCPVVFYMDNAKVHSADIVSELLNLVAAGDIEAIEIYRSAAEVPGELSGPDARCGVVAVWTRRSRP